MTGWKTKTGATLIGSGGLLIQVPVPPVQVVGGIMVAVGAFFTIIGLGHKVEKAAEKISERTGC